MSITEEVKDLDMRLKIFLCISAKGDGFDTVILPKGTFFNKPEKIGNHSIFESPCIEKGKIIFVNSKEMQYGY